MPTTYFCTTCQRRHNISDIGPNLYEALREQVRDGVSDAFSKVELSDADEQDALQELNNNLLKFVNDERYAEKYFIFPGSEIPTHISNQHQNGSSISGDFSLKLGWLLNAYEESGARKAYDADNLENENNVTAMAPEDIPADLSTRTIHSSRMTFSFDSTAFARKEWLFDHVTDENNSPFPQDDGKFAGYIRVCSHCGRKLARAVGRAPEIVAALAGVNRAGKTCCVGAIASGLYHGKYETNGIRFNRYSYDYEMQWLEDQVFRFYDEGKVMQKTNTDDDGTCGTYSFDLMFGNTRMVLTLVDMPGEFFGTADNSSLSKDFFTRYLGIYQNLDFVWFFVGKPVAYQMKLFDLTNPMGGQFKSVEDLYPTPESSPNPETWRIMHESNDSMLQVKACAPGTLSANLGVIRDGLKAAGRPLPPILVIMTKAELQIDEQETALIRKKGIFPPHSIDNFNKKSISEILRNDYSGYYIDEEKLFFVGSNARDVFSERARPFISAIENVFPHRFYTAISSYGHRAGENEEVNLPAPTPYNELMPLIWTLAVSGAAKIRQSCVWPNKGFMGMGYKEPTYGYESAPFMFRFYLTNRIPGKDQQEREDNLLKYQSAAHNLLFQNVNIGQPVKYAVTEFNHKKK